MAGGNKEIHNYLNTLIFCVIAKFVSVLLLIGLFVSKYLRENWSYAILTIVTGFIVLIIWSLFSIMKYNNDVKEALKKGGLSVVQMNQKSCPMYFDKKYDAVLDRVFCENSYVTPNNNDTLRFINTTTGSTFLPTSSNEFLYGESASNIDTLCNTIRSSKWEYMHYPYTDIKEYCQVYNK